MAERACICMRIVRVSDTCSISTIISADTAKVHTPVASPRESTQLGIDLADRYACPLTPIASTTVRDAAWIKWPWLLASASQLSISRTGCQIVGRVTVSKAVSS